MYHDVQAVALKSHPSFKHAVLSPDLLSTPPTLVSSLPGVLASEPSTTAQAAVAD